MPLKKNRVGQTNLSVTSLSLGGSSLGNLGGIVSDADAAALLQHAWNAGIRYFDTAPHYGRGLSEQRMGAYFKGRARDSYVLSSKVGRVLSPGSAMDEADGFVQPLPNAVHYDYSADGIHESFESSCERLGTSQIDILFVHDIGDQTHGVLEGARHMEDLLGSGMEALHDLKQAGRIRAIGLGVNESQVCIDVMKQTPLDVILLAGRLTLLDREAEAGLVELCALHGTSLVLGGIFNSGILATGPVPGAWFDYAPASQEVLDRVANLESKAEAVNLTLAQAALQFAMHHPSACSVLLGTGKVRSLQRNLDAADITLSESAKAFVTA
ncbi:aldo/keto reductase [Granulosicoccus antarcticus]|uniref:Pyridoxal 4-dehydrogenase n=1 Tax=Granulosicoccus antarcticus IMCC3135 TaxID=1192854 RepID=A0A2Z2NPZ1_9GAMM|nr:aldo/keto reductase [Granulosicoccus antarcticus]ASJ72001.1 Pyridoxal 4-dehydrogenase [Granulosicoccus antarcticus IMCC3135]